MCGYLLKYDSQGGIREGEILRQIKKIRHRGPDAEHCWVSSCSQLGMAHVRLSIQDLSAEGDQPFILGNGNDSDPYALAYNGEIYNCLSLKLELEKLGMVFRSHSDTEVIMLGYQYWGEDILKKLNGMFSFALYDPKRKMILFARDRYGQKPLYFRHTSSGITISSDAGLLQKSGKAELNYKAVSNYFAYGYMPSKISIFKETHKLEAGSCCRYDIKSGKLERFSFTPEYEADDSTPKTDQTVINELDELILRAVDRHLVSDVPVGLLLSSGIDSSLILSYLKELNVKLTTYTASYGGGDADESELAEQFSENMGFDWQGLPLQEFSLSDFSDYISKLDEPLADPAALGVYQLTRQLKKQNVKVVLTGDGGDELFLGYPHYHKVQQVDRLKRMLKVIGLQGRMARLFKYSKYSNRVSSAFDKSYSPGVFVNMYFNYYERAALGICSEFPEQNKQDLIDSINLDIVLQQQYLDMQTTMTDGYLVKSDRASMANSVELRAPFLDERLYQYFSQHRNMISCSLRESSKYYLRELGKRRLPSVILQQRKRGFHFPLEKFLFGNLEHKQYFHNLISESRLLKETDLMLALFERAQSESFLLHRVYAILVFLAWAKNVQV